MQGDRAMKTVTDADSLAGYCSDLHLKREMEKTVQKKGGRQRVPLSQSERKAVLGKTGARCHICGGRIVGSWHADHVMAHSAGGSHSVDNYLPAHATCNNYRWDYLPEEFQLILKLGVWARTEIERQTPVGLSIAKAFSAKEAALARRRAKRRDA